MRCSVKTFDHSNCKGEKIMSSFERKSMALFVRSKENRVND